MLLTTKRITCVPGAPETRKAWAVASRSVARGVAPAAAVEIDPSAIQILGDVAVVRGVEVAQIVGGRRLRIQTDLQFTEAFSVESLRLTP